LLSSVDDQSSAIIKSEKIASLENFSLPSYVQKPSVVSPVKNSNAEVVHTSGGASNAWVVNQVKTKDQKAILMNDPHLSHSWPSNFYLATLEAPDFFATGASFVGLPGILIGGSKK